FSYKYEQGHAVDENGVEPMELFIEKEVFAIEATSSRTHFIRNKSSERPSPVIHQAINERMSEDVNMKYWNKRGYTFYSDEKTSFFIYFFSKSPSAAAAAKQLNIHVCAAHQ
ncbi:hypothetical protein CLU79DRAFT_711127, partial [Phycomyces nitens]